MNTGPAGFSASLVSDALPAGTASDSLGSAVPLEQFAIDIDGWANQLPDLSIPNVAAGSHTVTLALLGNPSNYITASSTRLVALATS